MMGVIIDGVRVRWLVVTACACGRVDFDPVSGDASGPGLVSIAVGGTGPDAAEAIAIDEAGNLYVAGWFSDVVDFGTGPVTSFGDTDALVASYDPRGALRWLRPYGSIGVDRAMEIAFLPDGDLLVAGRFGGTTDFGGGDVTPNGSDDAYLLRLTRGGGFVSVAAFGGSAPQIAYGNDYAETLAVGPDGHVFVGGAFVGSADFGAGATTSLGAGTNGFVAAIAPFDPAPWSVRFGDTRLNDALRLAADSLSVYVAGYYEGAPDLGAGPLPLANGQDAVVARLDAATGALQWTVAFGGLNFDYATSVGVGGDGTAFVTGFFDASADFGTGLVTSRGRDMYLAAYTSGGTLRYAIPFGSAGCDQTRALLVEPDDVWVAGTFEMRLDIAGMHLDAVSGYDAFLARFSYTGELRQLVRLGDTENDLAMDLARTPRGTLMVAGSVGGLAACAGGRNGGEGDLWIKEL